MPGRIGIFTMSSELLFAYVEVANTLTEVSKKLRLKRYANNTNYDSSPWPACNLEENSLYHIAIKPSGNFLFTSSFYLAWDDQKIGIYKRINFKGRWNLTTKFVLTMYKDCRSNRPHCDLMLLIALTKSFVLQWWLNWFAEKTLFRSSKLSSFFKVLWLFFPLSFTSFFAF